MRENGVTASPLGVFDDSEQVVHKLADVAVHGENAADNSTQVDNKAAEGHSSVLIADLDGIEVVHEEHARNEVGCLDGVEIEAVMGH